MDSAHPRRTGSWRRSLILKAIIADELLRECTVGIPAWKSSFANCAYVLVKGFFEHGVAPNASVSCQNSDS